jgi:hypothetical protein
MAFILSSLRGKGGGGAFTPLLPRFLGGTAPLYVVVPIRPRQSRSNQVTYSGHDRLVARVMLDYDARNELEPRASLPRQARSVYVSRYDQRFVILISIEPVPNRILSLFALPHE